jgi:hypothetical protein
MTDPINAPGARFDRLSGLLAVVTLLLGLMLRLGLACWEQGIYYPDEIHQSFEPAHRLVFGYGFVSHEYQVGLRSWLLPGVLAGLLWMADTLGLHRPSQYLAAVHTLIALGGLSSAGAAAWLALPAGGRGGARIAAAAVAMSAPMIYLSHRGLSESVTLPLVAWGVALVLVGRRPALGAVLLTLSTGMRLQNGIFLAIALAQLAARRDPRTFRHASAGFVVTALAIGVLDRLTWGSWFHTPLTYLAYQVQAGGLGTINPQPPWYYLTTALTSEGLPLLLLVPLALVAGRRQPWLLVYALLPVLAHSLVPYKQLRFIVPSFPFWAAAAGVGLAALGRRSGREPLACLVGVTVVALSAAKVPLLTFGALGQAFVAPATRSAYDFQGGGFRLLERAGELHDLCGLRVDNRPRPRLGGYTWLHRDVPLYAAQLDEHPDGHVNYAIGDRPLLPGETLVARDGAYLLVRLPVTGCAPDPDYHRRLN